MNNRSLALLLPLALASQMLAQEPVAAPATLPALLAPAIDAPATQPDLLDAETAATLPAIDEASATQPSDDAATGPTTTRSSSFASQRTTSSRSSGTSNSASSLVEIIRAKSIFSKDRQPPRRWTEPRTRSSWQSSRPSRPRLPILIGVARAETDLVAVIELPDERRVIELRPGDLLPNNAGVLEKITLDEIEIASAPGATTRSVKVGQDLEGASADPTTAPGADASDGSASSIDGDDPISRMRRRRMQEMNR